MSIAATTRGVTGCVLVLMLWLGMSLTAPPAVAEPPEGELRVQLDQMSPAVLRPGDDLRIHLTVFNDSTQTVSNPAVELIMQRHVLSSRTAVDNWHQGLTSSRLGTATPFSATLEQDLGPRSATTFVITMPAEPTFAETSAWGPRGIEVNVTGNGASAAARTLLLWFPSDSPIAAPAELSLVAPLTPTAAEWHQAATDGQPVATTAASRLLPVLDAAADQQISWALDPALLETGPLVHPAPLDLLAEDEPDPATEPPPDPGPQETQVPDDGDAGGTGAGTSTQGGETDEPGGSPNGSSDDATDPPPKTTQAEPADTTPSTSAQTGTDLGARLVQGAAGRDLLALGYADADLGAMTHAGDLSLWRLGQDRGAALLDRAGLRTLNDVHLPGGQVDGTTLAALATEGAQTVVTPEAALDPGPGVAPNGASTQVHTAAGPVHVVVPDERISALLSSVDSDGADLQPLIGRQLVLADTAAAVRSGDHHTPGFLATLPRDLTEDDLHGHLEELRDAPWLELTNLRGLLGRTPAPQSRTPATEQSTDPSRLGTRQVEDLEQIHQDVTTLSTTLAAPGMLLDLLEPALLTTLSGAWAGSTDDRHDLLDQVQQLSGNMIGAVRVEPGSSVLLINHSGDLPVTVANDLPVPAQVTVALRPQDPRLRAGEPVQAVLEPETITTVRVPIQAVANGNVTLDVQVLAADGSDVGHGASFTVRVRADWEDIGTAIVAGLLAVAFVIGLVRTIRSGRRRFPPASATAGSRADE